jgi:hypothetical protein
VSKSVSQNLVSDTRTTTLQQYVFTFTYNLNNFKGSQHGRTPGQFPGGRLRSGGGGGGFRKGN